VSYRISGLDPEAFRPLFDLSDAALVGRGAKRILVDEPNGTPCRVSLEEAAAGEEVLLLPYQHLGPPSPYQAMGPIFVRRSARSAGEYRDRVPEMQRRRLSSVRVFDAQGWLLESDVIPGNELDGRLRRWMEDPSVTFVDVHNAKPGCFAFRVRRD
jgi:hypothetical protein